MNEWIQIEETDYRIIPRCWVPTKFHTITFHGWQFVISAQDQSCIDLFELASSTVTSFVRIYKNTHAFTEPQLSIKPDGEITIKIGTMENERYDELDKND
jgi:hypothetical protein